VTHTMSATSTLPVYPTRSVRRTSGLVLVGYSEIRTLTPIATKRQFTSRLPRLGFQQRP
jgi:hypothetical protein